MVPHPGRNRITEAASRCTEAWCVHPGPARAIQRELNASRSSASAPPMPSTLTRDPAKPGSPRSPLEVLAEMPRQTSSTPPDPTEKTALAGGTTVTKRFGLAHFRSDHTGLVLGLRVVLPGGDLWW